MHAFDVLGDPVRRRILELLATGERSSGAGARPSGTSSASPSPPPSVRPEGARRLYAVRPEPLRDVDAWLDRFRAPHLDALARELTPDERTEP